jgi:hypothetical protein
MPNRIDFDAPTRKKLEAYVKDNFPDAECDAEGDVITGVALGLWLNQRTEIDLAAYGLQLDALVMETSLDPDAPGALVAPGDPYRYYNVRATHDREVPDLDAFVGRIPMVRVRLPGARADSRDYKTELGDILQSDHFYRSAEEFRNRYAGQVPYERAARLDLITPPRANPFQMRFGAISVYLGYLDANAEPAFYVLEAGTATGQPKVAFPAPSFDNGVYAYAGYTPTPFTDKRHIYKGALEWRESGVKRLKMSARKDAAAAPYMRLDVRFDETTTPWRIWPGFLILRAAMIVLARKGVVGT